MLRRLIRELCERGPLDRSTSEMAGLLARTGEGGWPMRPLLARRDGYTRTCAFRSDQFEVLLLNWAAGAASQLHDHGDQHCWMLVMDGELIVDDYARLDSGSVSGYACVEARDSRLLRPGGLDLRSGPFDLHRVSATPQTPALSLHVYSGPLRSYLVYDELASSCRSVRGAYDDVLFSWADPLRR